MKIFKQITASGKEWKPCIECGRRFEHGEIITALSRDDGICVRYWYCSGCIESWWPLWSLPAVESPGPKEYFVHLKEDVIEKMDIDRFNGTGRRALYAGAIV